MNIEHYGEWTQIVYEDESREDKWEMGYQYYLVAKKSGVKGYAHRKHGEIVKKWGTIIHKLGWTVSEIIGIGIVNDRTINRIKVK